jgi:hypothetical protein
LSVNVVIVFFCHSRENGNPAFSMGSGYPLSRV